MSLLDNNNNNNSSCNNNTIKEERGIIFQLSSKEDGAIILDKLSKNEEREMEVEMNKEFDERAPIISNIANQLAWLDSESLFNIFYKVFDSVTTEKLKVIESNFWHAVEIEEKVLGEMDFERANSVQH